jgi:cysteinyl-tRNA synthetase
VLEERCGRSADLVGEAFDGKFIKRTRKGFRTAMNDDFNTREAIARLHEFATAVNKVLGDELLLKDMEVLEEAASLFDEMDDVLGLFYRTDDDTGSKARGKAGGEDDLSQTLMEFILEMREQARRDKDFARADSIRDGLKALGIEVEDGPGGPRWRRAE